jgi:hypothetical protein
VNPVVNQRLIDDVAFATSRHVLEVFADCIREEQHRDAFEEIYERVKAGIECFQIEHNRMLRRLDPGSN